MQATTVFHPMSHRPKPSEDVPAWSETVIVFEQDHDFEDFGYFDFEQDQWHVLGENSMKLICWCEIPTPPKDVTKQFNAVKHNGYIE